MALEPGTKLGSYVIAAPLGAGAMGEVYRAHDGTLGREVALKVLPAELAADPERLARFDREAKVLASLNHPNIATIHGTVDESGRRALVMELVPGEDLAARIERGPIPLDEAIPIARQIAEGLEAAHEIGIVHRDLKPANVKITPTGQVKVLDFGLAKAVERTTSATSPTITSLGTVAGVILGTAAYMSPEQARGKETDRRADIWAFGVILVEMLTGRRMFDGETISDTLAAVLTRNPDWSLLPATTPPALRRLLERCLDRDPRTRLRDIGEARVALASPMASEPAKAPVRSGSSVAQVLAITIVAAVVGALANRWLSRKPVAVAHPMAFDIAGGPAMRLGSIALSPDGRTLVYSARRDDGGSELWVRPMDALEARPLPGTRQAEFPFWSPDGREIGFFASGHLLRMALDETTPHRIAAASRAAGGSWGTGGSILFGSMNGPVLRVAAKGGSAPVAVTRLTGSETGHAWPSFLPDGKRFVFLADAPNVEAHALRLGSIDGGETPSLLTKIRSAPFVDPRGRLLVVRDSQLVALPFDLSSATVRDEPSLVVEGIHPMGMVHHTPVSLSNDGMLAYQTATSAGTLTRFDLKGKLVARLSEPEGIDEPAMSPDGRSVAITVSPNADERRLWVLDVARGVRTPVSAAGAFADDPVWSPDGKNLYFDSNVGGRWTTYRAWITEGRAIEEIGDPGGPDMAVLDISKDGRHLLLSSFDAAGNWELFVRDLSLPREAKWTPWFSSPAKEDGGTFSPDGRWIAFVADVSGADEVYLAPVEGGPAVRRWQVSVGGGVEPRWSADGERLFYRNPGNELVSVPVSVAAARADIGAAVRHFQLPLGVGGYPRMSYSLLPDASEVITIQRPESNAPAIHVRTGW